MRFPDDASKDVHTRLRRIEGQVRGIQRLVSDGAECREIVTQLAAATSALDRVGFKLFSAGMRECINNPDSGLDPEELERLFLKLT